MPTDIIDPGLLTGIAYLSLFILVFTAAAVAIIGCFMFAPPPLRQGRWLSARAAAKSNADRDRLDVKYVTDYDSFSEPGDRDVDEGIPRFVYLTLFPAAVAILVFGVFNIALAEHTDSEAKASWTKEMNEWVNSEYDVAEGTDISGFDFGYCDDLDSRCATGTVVQGNAAIDVALVFVDGDPMLIDRGTSYELQVIGS